MSKENLHNESSLVQEMQAGNEEAFTTLYRHYSPRLYLNILGMVHDPALAEEIVQELFTRVWQKRDSIGITENFAGYIYTIGQHLVHDFFRKLLRDQRLMAKFRLLAGKHYQHVEESLEQRESSAVLNKAFEQLSPQQKKVYKLVKVEGYTYKQTAEIMHISPLTVKEYLVTTKKSIQKYMLTHMDNEFNLLLFIAICAIV